MQSDPIGLNFDYSNPLYAVLGGLGIRLYPGDGNLGLNDLYGYANQNPLIYADPYGLNPNGSCGPGHIFCNFPELAGEVTKQSLSHAFKNSRLVASRHDIRKVNKLCENFGGKPRDWKKKAGVDDKGREWHWYEKRGGQKYGLKPEGYNDPF